jgi:5-methylcytosine-specific restriction endonuclease McrBC GTP-binding regulatory subunit McrB
MNDEPIDLIERALRNHGHRSIITLSGVAGTGKTHYALRAAERLTGSVLFVRQIQFHSTYGYEDLIEGLRPNSRGGFDLLPGSLIEWNDQALSDPTNRYVFLIEELTRANVSGVLGELFTYIEHRDRFFQLPISKRQVRIAPNLNVLATMNPQDKSALELDDALIRRLRIISFPPSIAELQKMLDQSLSGTDAAERDRITQGLTKLFETCKLRFPDSFEESMPFGHGVFAGVRTEEDLVCLWQEQLRYLLQRNPHVPLHPFAETIRGAFPWKSRT